MHKSNKTPDKIVLFTAPREDGLEIAASCCAEWMSIK
jgi:hypothetical protein